jgi:hypothetical protein
MNIDFSIISTEGRLDLTQFTGFTGRRALY